MSNENSATASTSPALSGDAHAPRISRSGLVFGFFGVLAFSFTLPFTRIAVEQIDPLFIGAGRAVVAAVLAIVVLAITRQRLPRGRQWLRLAVVAVGVVAGFPLLTSFALQTVPAAHGAVVIGLLPAAMAVAGGGLDGLHPSDLLLLGAVVLAAIGYAEGALLSRELGSWQTICWALVVGLPLMVPLTGVSVATSGWPQADTVHWLAFGYLALVSMFLGFFSWYRGLAIGPIAQVSQIQLVQPVLTIVWSALVVGERLDLLVWLGALVVVACAATAVRARVASAGIRAR